MRRLIPLLATLGLALPARAQEQYGAKGIFPVYESAPQWVIFDKRPSKKTPTPIGPGERFLVVGSRGAEVFEVKRDSGTYGGMCRGRRPLKLRAGLLVGPRGKVGRPIIGIHVPETFSLKGSHAVYKALKNEVSEDSYQKLEGPVKAAVLKDAADGSFRLKADDPAAEQFIKEPKAELVQTKIDFGAALPVSGLGEPFVFVEESQIGAASRRCLRLAVEDRLIGGCAEMPRALMAETELLQFVAYDPSGKGSPFLMAFTKTPPLWGDERWGFVVRSNGPRLFLVDAEDPRCRAGF
jgi:hypothetical protein